MKEIIDSKTVQLLKERFERVDGGGTNSYAKFLRRKRLEQKNFTRRSKWGMQSQLSFKN